MKTIKIFKAIWCGPCRAIAPMIDQIKTEFTDISFNSIDVDENPEESIKYGITSVPTILFIENDEVKGSHKGALTKSALKTLIGQNFSLSS